MNQKKGSVHIGAVIGIIVILLITAAGVGYYIYQKNVPSVQIGEDGVSVNVNGINVQTDENGASVVMPGFDAQVDGDNVSVDLPGMNATVDGDSVSLNTGNASMNVNNNSTVESSGSSDEKINTVLIFDASGSMAAKSGTETRMDIAKKAMANYVQNMDENVYLSVLAYGHKGDNTQAGKAESCNGIEEIYYMGAVDDAVVVSKVNKLQPNGWTPMSDSLQKAASILNKSATPGTKKHIVLLSDGEETCGSDPVVVAKQLKADGITIDVIGLNVEGATQQQLNNISIGGGGVYYAVGDANDFNAVVNDMGVKLNTGNLQMNVTDDGVSIQGENGLNIEANENGATVEMDGMDIQATDDNVSVDVPGVSIPSF